MVSSTDSRELGRRVPDWLPRGKQAGICLTVDDIHPGKSSDAYEAGGDLNQGALRHVEWLVRQHPQLKVTLFVTASWREVDPTIDRTLIARIPYLRDKFHLSAVLPRNQMRLSNHPDFVDYLKSMRNVDAGFHGLYHARKGLNLPAEFKDLKRSRCVAFLSQMIAAFEEATLPFVPGMCPPLWDLSDELADAMVDVGLTFVGSARDLITPISPDAVTAMSGRWGVSLIYPEWIRQDKLLHFTSNFQATSPLSRAKEIIESGGLVAIKAHIIKQAFGHVALDGLDEEYRDYLHHVFCELEDRYGDALWWTSMADITALRKSTKNIEQQLGCVNG